MENLHRRGRLRRTAVEGKVSRMGEGVTVWKRKEISASLQGL